MGSEDVGVFGLDHQQIPVVYFRLGAMDPAQTRRRRARPAKIFPACTPAASNPFRSLQFKPASPAMSAVAISLLQ